MSNQCHIFRIDDGERHWYSATSRDDAIGQHSALIGEDAESLIADGMEVTQLDDDELLTIYLDEPFRDPSPKATKTAAEWAAGGRDIIGATVC